MSPDEISRKLRRDGFVLVRNVFDASAADQLIDCVTSNEADHSRRGGATYGARNLLGLARVKAASTSAALYNILAPALGPYFQAVRAIYFDKTPKANWPVSWHQDLSLAVLQRRELPGWINWTTKRGVLHVQPPAGVLEKMVTARIHLDDCPINNGPLRVIAGSHRDGVLTRDQIGPITKTAPAVVITACQGDVMLMKPLLLHASSPAQNPAHRRVLHLEFAPAKLLPDELSWAAMA